LHVVTSSPCYTVLRSRKHLQNPCSLKRITGRDLCEVRSHLRRPPSPPRGSGACYTCYTVCDTATILYAVTSSGVQPAETLQPKVGHVAGSICKVRSHLRRPPCSPIATPGSSLRLGRPVTSSFRLVSSLLDHRTMSFPTSTEPNIQFAYLLH
jgi:hypothetical protein